jgi:hypothetical protein
MMLSSVVVTAIPAQTFATSEIARQNCCVGASGTGKTTINKRDELLAKVESRLWQAMRAKGMHHMSFRRKCQLAREALRP